MEATPEPLSFRSAWSLGSAFTSATNRSSSALLIVSSKYFSRRTPRGGQNACCRMRRRRPDAPQLGILIEEPAIEQLLHRVRHDEDIGSAARHFDLDFAGRHAATVDHVAEPSGTREPAEREATVPSPQLEPIGIAMIGEVVAEAQHVRAADLLWHVSVYEPLNGGSKLLRGAEPAPAEHAVPERPALAAPGRCHELDAAVHHVDQKAADASDGRVIRLKERCSARLAEFAPRLSSCGAADDGLGRQGFSVLQH